MPEEIIRAETIAITGNRDYPDRAGLLRGLDRLRANRYLFGGARGADSDALEYLARTQPGSQRVVVVPNRVVNQPLAAQVAIRNYATQVIELGNAGADRYQIRNQYLVDNADRVAAFTDGRTSGGTWNTIQYAQSRGASISIFPLVELNEAAIMAMETAEFNAWLDTCVEAKVPMLSIKGLAIRRMKLLPRGDWPGVLVKVHRLK